MPTKVHTNIVRIKAKLAKAMVKKKSLRDKMYQKVNQKFLIKKERLINDFENHPVTQEIKAGPTSSNISRTLGGYGNLYSFIGFDGGNPTDKVTQALRAGVRLLRTPHVTKRGKSVMYMYTVKFPTTTELGSAAPMPWEPGNWVSRIERGISGLGSYIYSMGIAKSRSGTGVQSKGRARTAIYSRVSYMSAILSTFRKGWNLV